LRHFLRRCTIRSFSVKSIVTRFHLLNQTFRRFAPWSLILCDLELGCADLHSRHPHQGFACSQGVPITFRLIPKLDKPVDGLRTFFRWNVPPFDNRLGVNPHHSISLMLGPCFSPKSPHTPRQCKVNDSFHSSCAWKAPSSFFSDSSLSTIDLINSLF